MLLLKISAIILFLFGAITGHIIGKSGGDGCRFLGFVGVVGSILFVMCQAQTVDIVGKRTEASLERQRHIGAPQLAVLHHVVDFQVRVEIGALLLHTGTSIVAMTMQAAAQLTGFQRFHCFTVPA